MSPIQIYRIYMYLFVPNIYIYTYICTYYVIHTRRMRMRNCSTLCPGHTEHSAFWCPPC